MSSYSIADTPQRITCHLCGRTSHHPEDVRQRYCANCHVFHDDLARLVWAVRKGIVAPEYLDEYLGQTLAAQAVLAQCAPKEEPHAS
jgi:ribosomal protein L37E